MDRIALRLEHRAQERTGRSLAVGACDMEHRWQSTVRIAQPVEQGAHGFETQPAIGNGKAPQPVELCLDPGMIGAGEVPHRAGQAALAGAR